MRSESNAEVSDFLRRLERLVTRLLGRKLRNADGLFRLQLDLLELQRDIQDSIAVAKRSGWSDELEELRRVRWHCRRFGDAFAWVMLGMDDQLIHPLSENDAVPIPTHGHGSRGVVGLAESMWRSGAGFPLLHDATDVLRIGDLTIIHPVENSTELRTETIEVKTRVVESVPKGSETQYTYEISAYASAKSARNPFEFLETTMTPETAERWPGAVQDARARRQLERMDRAVQRQQAAVGATYELDGVPTLAVDAPPSSGATTESLRRVARLARRRGAASAEVEGCMAIAAVYHPDGPSGEQLKALVAQAMDPLLASPVFAPAQRSEEAALLVNAVPTKTTKSAQLFLPFYLYPLPRQTILDLMWGRMTIILIHNRARIVEELAARGMEVTPLSEQTKPDPWHFDLVVEPEPGLRLSVKESGRILHQYLLGLRGIDAYVDLLEKMTEAAAKVLSDPPS